MPVTHVVTIDDQSFVIAEENIDAVRAELKAAVRAGGEFVWFVVSPSHQAEVLVTAARQIRVDHRELFEDLDDIAADEADPDDWDMS